MLSWCPNSRPLSILSQRHQPSMCHSLDGRSSSLQCWNNIRPCYPCRLTRVPFAFQHALKELSTVVSVALEFYIKTPAWTELMQTAMIASAPISSQDAPFVQALNISIVLVATDRADYAIFAVAAESSSVQCDATGVGRCMECQVAGWLASSSLNGSTCLGVLPKGLNSYVVSGNVITGTFLNQLDKALATSKGMPRKCLCLILRFPKSSAAI